MYKRKGYIWKGVEYSNRSDWMKARMSDPVYAKAMVQAGNSPEACAKRSAKFTKLWQTKEYREMQHHAQEGAHQTLEAVTHAVLAQRKIWSNPDRCPSELRRRMGVSQRKRFTEQEHPMQGKHHTLKSRRLMSKSRLRAIEEGRIVPHEPWMVSGLTAKKDPRVAKQRKGLLRAYAEGRRRAGFSYHRAWYTGKGVQIAMRSSWEVAFAKYLDSLGFRWQYEPVSFDLGNTSYTPDFYLQDFKLYVEIKGRLTIDQEKKYVAFQQQYSKVNWVMLRGWPEETPIQFQLALQEGVAYGAI